MPLGLTEEVAAGYSEAQRVTFAKGRVDNWVLIGRSQTRGGEIRYEYAHHTLGGGNVARAVFVGDSGGQREVYITGWAEEDITLPIKLRKMMRQVYGI